MGDVKFTEVVFYMRSTIAEGGSDHIKEQQKILLDFCLEKLYMVAEQFYEISEGENFIRHEWQDLLDFMAKNKHIKYIFITRFDRFCTDLKIASKMTKYLQREDITLYSIEEKFIVTEIKDIN